GHGRPTWTPAARSTPSRPPTRRPGSPAGPSFLARGRTSSKPRRPPAAPAAVAARGPLDAAATADATVWLAGRSVLRGDGSNFTQVATAPRRGRFSAIAATAGQRAVALGFCGRRR